MKTGGGGGLSKISFTPCQSFDNISSRTPPKDWPKILKHQISSILEQLMQNILPPTDGVGL